MGEFPSRDAGSLTQQDRDELRIYMSGGTLECRSKSRIYFEPRHPESQDYLIVEFESRPRGELCQLFVYIKNAESNYRYSNLGNFSFNLLEQTQMSPLRIEGQCIERNRILFEGINHGSKYIISFPGDEGGNLAELPLPPSSLRAANRVNPSRES